MGGLEPRSGAGMSLLQFRRQTTTAETVTAGSVRVTPEARAWIVRLPFGGLVWHRPAAVRIEGAGGSRRVPIRDHTGLAFLGLLALAFAAAAGVALSLLGGRRKRR